MSVDLSALEVGDSVKLRSEETATVNWISKNEYNGFNIYLFMVGVRNNPIPFNDNWYESGVIQFSNEYDNDIVEIIKNPKQWTDDDMKEAYAQGAASVSGRTKAYYLRMYANSWTVFSDWLEKYKVNRK